MRAQTPWVNSVLIGITRRGKLPKYRRCARVFGSRQMVSRELSISQCKMYIVNRKSAERDGQWITHTQKTTPNQTTTHDIGKYVNHCTAGDALILRWIHVCVSVCVCLLAERLDAPLAAVCRQPNPLPESRPYNRTAHTTPRVHM